MVSFVTPKVRKKPESTDLVDAVVMLRPHADDRVPTPSESRVIVSSVLQQATQETGLKPAASTVFANMNSFSVRAASEFVDAIARSASVAEVVPNEQPSLLIAPVKRRSVKIE